LALTANTNPVDRKRCLAAGMQEVLQKPIEMGVLMATVGQYVRRAREGKL
jgi:CheY-like chemotaxis protein